jgi:hypothetical protein
VTAMQGGRGRLEGRCYGIYSYSGGIACQTTERSAEREGRWASFRSFDAMECKW